MHFWSIPPIEHNEKLLQQEARQQKLRQNNIAAEQRLTAIKKSLENETKEERKRELIERKKMDLPFPMPNKRI